MSREGWLSSCRGANDSGGASWEVQDVLLGNEHIGRPEGVGG